MSKQYTRRYLDYADSIPYAPNIKNLFTGGGGMSTLTEVMGSSEGVNSAGNSSVGSSSVNSFSSGGGPKGLIGEIIEGISVTGLALGQGLSEIGQWRLQKWQEKQADERAAFKRVEEGNKAFNQFLNQLQENKNKAIQELLILALQTVALRNLRQAAALSELNGGTPESNKYGIGGLITAGIAVDKGLGSAIGGEYHSGVGDVMSKIPGLGIVGGLTNALFGIKTNKAKLQAVENTKSNLTNAAMAAGTASTFDSSALSSSPAVNYGNTKVYSGGTFKKSEANKKNAEVKRLLIEAEDFADRAIVNGIENITKNNDSSLAAVYRAYGGILLPYSPEFNLRALGGYTPTFGNGAIGYAFTNDYLHNGYLNANRENKLEALNTNDIYLNNNSTMFAEGGNMNTVTEDYQEGNIYNINEEEYRKLLEEGYQVKVIND